MSCDSQCSVDHPHATVGWSAVCDCGIYRSYSLAFLMFCTIRGKSIVIGPDMDPEGHQFTLYYFELHSDQIELFLVSNFCHAIV